MEFWFQSLFWNHASLPVALALGLLAIARLEFRSKSWKILAIVLYLPYALITILIAGIATSCANNVCL
jgi:ABC-type sugar transport system permease subunit